jgi:aryl-alcohol dehydrogenase-like predicted oxidoreductase
MGLLPYGTLGQGRFQTEAVYNEREKDNPGRKMKPATTLEKDVSKVLEKIAKAKSTELTSVALAYVMHKTPYVFPIVGGRKLEHIKGNIAALGISLSLEGIKEIEGVYEFDPGFPHTFLTGTLLSNSTPRGAGGPGDVFLTKMLGNFDWVEAEKPIPPAKM